MCIDTNIIGTNQILLFFFLIFVSVVSYIYFNRLFRVKIVLLANAFLSERSDLFTCGYFQVVKLFPYKNSFPNLCV